jgi:hypothetical protein
VLIGCEREKVIRKSERKSEGERAKEVYIFEGLVDRNEEAEGRWLKSLPMDQISKKASNPKCRLFLKIYL